MIPYFIGTTGYLSGGGHTLSRRECGQFRPYVHENFEKFKMISIPTGSWIHLEFFKIFMNIGTELSTLSMGQSIYRII